MSRRVRLAVMTVITALALNSSAWSSTVEAGMVRLPKAINVDGMEIAKGKYEVVLKDGAAGTEIALLSDNGSTLVSELAIVVPSKRAARKTRASAVYLKAGENLVRVTVKHENERYLVFFESPY